jgi:hypothetical protein
MYGSDAVNYSLAKKSASKSQSVIIDKEDHTKPGKSDASTSPSISVSQISA